MKAFFITNPGEYRIGETAEPILEPGHVLLQPKLIGMCGTDLSSFRGRNPLVSYPRIPGHEIAARIVECGAGVPERFRVGTDVTVSPYTACGICASCLRGRPNACQNNQTLGVQRDGAMASFFQVPWQKIFIAEGLPLRELVLVEPLSVGFHAAARGRVSDTDTVAVVGCGVVGLGAISASAFRGARTIAIDVDDDKLRTAKLCGAAHTINSKRESVHGELRALTQGLGPDVFIEAVGLPELFRMAIDEVAYTGRVVYVGYAKESVTYETRFFLLKELDILGSRNALDEFGTVIEMFRGGRFPLENIISKTTNLEGTGEALTAWAANPSGFTKILVDMD